LTAHLGFDGVPFALIELPKNAFDVFYCLAHLLLVVGIESFDSRRTRSLVIYYGLGFACPVTSKARTPEHLVWTSQHGVRRPWLENDRAKLPFGGCGRSRGE
jgi:hypothetical protein